MEEALFTANKRGYLPSEHARGPWDRTAMHGGPPAALMASVMEALPTEAPMAVVRTTVEIFRPVPLRPVEVSARIEREGRRVQLLTASLTDGNTELCRATAWRMRIADLDLGERPPLEVPFPGPDSAVAHVSETDDPAFHQTGVEMRFARGAFMKQGPATVWIRLAIPLIAGKTPTPLQRVIAAADFGNGVASALPWGRFLFINTDLTVYLARTPEGEWIGLDASTDVDPRGTGVAYSRLYDERGPIGHALQSLFIDRLRVVPPEQ
ncbi:MAG: thioesterase family protein [Candidatus Dormiibacterota bacterium]